MNKRGFTLVELLLASVLTTLFMAGVLAVLTNLTRASLSLGPASTSAQPAAPLPGELDRFVQLLRQDLQHARRIDALHPSELALTGQHSLEGVALDVSHRPVQVLYALETLAGRAWVVRRQSFLDVASNQNARQDLLVTGITRFELVPFGFPPTAAAAAPSATAPGRGRLQELTELRQALKSTDQAWLHAAAPSWAHPAAAATAPDSPDTPADAPSPSIDNLLTQYAPPAGILWRLRVWTSSSSTPAYDQLVTVQ